jgi:hypothetical protein
MRGPGTLARVHYAVAASPAAFVVAAAPGHDRGAARRAGCSGVRARCDSRFAEARPSEDRLPWCRVGPGHVRRIPEALSRAARAFGSAATVAKSQVCN